MRIEAEGETLKYVSVSISNLRLSLFLSNRLDLRDIYEFPENGVWFIVLLHDGKLIFNQWPEANIPEEYLPEYGFVYEGDLENSPFSFAHFLGNHTHDLIQVAYCSLHENF